MIDENVIQIAESNANLLGSPARIDNRFNNNARTEPVRDAVKGFSTQSPISMEIPVSFETVLKFKAMVIMLPRITA